jgi:hypothetical protein
MHVGGLDFAFFEANPGYWKVAISREAEKED